ncbi:MAG: DedA family protein [Burkholderiaceae bacterium]|nr:DedA family protein [Burkholderiaceae bacterium]
MELGPLIATHGYWILALGCLLEGETLLALAGFAAHLGYLELRWVWTVAAIAGFAGDQLFFWFGRRYGNALLARWPRLAAQRSRVQRLLSRHDGWLIVSVRFAYGLRIAGPMLIGAAGVAPARFAAFNAIGAMLWAAAVAGAGWLFGQALQSLLGRLHRIEAAILLGALALALLVALARRIARGRSR